MEGQEAVSGRFEPGAFTGEIAPAAIGVLRGE